MWWVGWPAAAVFCYLRARRRGQADGVANPPVPDEALEGWRREIGQAVRGATGGAALQEGLPPTDVVPADVLAAFASRYSVEREVRNLWERVFGEAAPRRGMTLLIEPLVNEGALSGELASAIEMVSRVASPAVHVQPISEAKVRFLQEVAPGLAAAVRSLRTKL